MTINLEITKPTKNYENFINYKENINTTTKGNETKEGASTTWKEISNIDEEKNART